ncbi:CREB-regulated transcription coactivator 1-like isoform X5 [Physella acuta]|uniref:CREB-regulated transcription coactivator 1-like isoform X5 n=1 Tax=Physella acuta TaxID=109671 RepID=UPI0027DD8B4E|nr:CREB-regulated transcription coactivator 1-like isoform X5 [Physella acuta]
MANPRKFSEKIALHTQKQAEETAAFEAILQEVNSATRDPPRYQKQQHIAPNLGTYRGGSLPNVNQISANQGIDLQATLQHLDDMKQGRSTLVHGRQERQRQQIGPHRRNFPTDKRIDSSPYGSAYHLSPPPDTSWRSCGLSRTHRYLYSGLSLSRVHSDPSLHMNAMGNANNKNYTHPPVTPPSHRRIVEMVGENAGDGLQMNYWDSKKMGGPSRPKSCEVPNINIYPSQEHDGQNSSSVIPMTTSNTGSLPDLSVLQFPSPLSTPLDQEDPYNTGGTGNSPVSLSPTSPRHMPMSHQNPQSPNQRRRQTSGISLPSPLVLNQIGGQSTSASMTQYRNTSVSDSNCQSPTSPHSAPSYSPAQSPGITPTSQSVNSTFSDAYYIQQQQQQTNALQHQFEQFNMHQLEQFNNMSPLQVTSTNMCSTVMTTNGLNLVSNSNSTCAANDLAFSQQLGLALQYTQAAMLAMSSNDDIFQPHFLGPIDVMASGQFNSQLTMSSQNNRQMNQQNSLSSPTSGSKIPDIILTGADDMCRLPLDFAKDLGNAITGMSDSFDADFLTNDEAFKAGLDPLDFDEIQMLTDASLVADPATEDSFKLDRL